MSYLKFENMCDVVGTSLLSNKKYISPGSDIYCKPIMCYDFKEKNKCDNESKTLQQLSMYTKRCCERNRDTFKM